MVIEERLQWLEGRILILELIDRYAFCSDTRDAQEQMALFTMETNFEVFMDDKSPHQHRLSENPGRLDEKTGVS